MTTVNWTGERIDLLTSLWLDGVSAQMIARQLGDGATRSAVLGKVHRLQLVRTRTVTPARRARLGILRSDMVRPRETRVAGQAPCAKSPAGPSAPARIVRELASQTSLLRARRDQCRWPCGDPGQGDLPICGRAVSRGAYCPDHAALGYQGRGPKSLFALLGLTD
ncbi:MAG: GcrA cell cycle regulator [Brevundimonas sp.]|nr:MAG: GcrA cell cycle regulator [Brevundimonas sp.]